ncbi:MAG: DegT/DnrJ/EryC1/StrS aminotransferase family protein [Spirochaetales bacterium]|nr:DegT/DnrJ/EryC1/StrS aminotransferase family protein [Spirochaetales bacterium]
MKTYIPFSRPHLGREEEEAVTEVLKSGWLTTGQAAKRFEADFAGCTGARYALSVNSATAGLHLSLEAIGVPPGSYVLTTPYTFTATSEVIRYMGADPLFVDIEEDTYNINPNNIEARIRENGRKMAAILPVHIAGLPCNMKSIMEISRLHGIPVVEDAAHAFPVRLLGRYAGTFGATGVFSFYANKTITTGEGGMVVTDNEEIAARIKVMRLHGIDRESWDRYTTENPAWAYDVVAPGYKYNMPDITAAIGVRQLEKAFPMRDRRRDIALKYLNAFSGCNYLKLPVYDDEHAWHLFMIRLDGERLSISRDEFIRKLNNLGVGTSVHYIPLHLMTYYRTRYDLKPEQFPVSLNNYLNSLSLPIYPDLTDEEVDKIIQSVKSIGILHYKRALM